MRSAGFLRERPECAAAPVDGEETNDRVRAEFEILAADEEDARHLPRRLGDERAVVDAALVDDERHDALRLPRGELVIELSARRHAPEQEWRGAQLSMPGPLGEA